MTTPLAKLSVTKRKREMTEEGGMNVAAPAASSSSTPVLLTPRLALRGVGSVLHPSTAHSSSLLATPAAAQGMQHGGGMGGAPATPLLSMPSPSAELMPVLHARQQRQSMLEGVHSSSSSSSSAMLPMTPSSHAATAAGTMLARHGSFSAASSGSPSLSASSSAASSAAALSSPSPSLLSSHSAALRAVEQAALERERSLRIQVEEFRAAHRSASVDATEFALISSQRQARLEAALADALAEGDKLRASLRFVTGEEMEQGRELKEARARIVELERKGREERAEVGRMRAQLAVHGLRTPLATTASSSSSPSAAAAAAASSSSEVASTGPAASSEAAGQIQHLESLVSLQSSSLRELESQLSAAQSALDSLAQKERTILELKAQLTHSEARVNEMESQARSNATELAQAALLSKRAGDFVAMSSRYEIIQAENRKLQEHQSNVGLLQEQILSLSAALARRDSERTAQAQAEVMNAKLKQRLREWEDAVASLGLDAGTAAAEGEDQQQLDEKEDDASMGVSPDSKRARRSSRGGSAITPQPLLASYRALQSTNLSLVARSNALELQCKTSALEASTAQNALHDARSKLTALESSHTSHASEMLLLTRRVTLLTKEREGLKKVLDAYDSEEVALQPRVLAPSASSAAGGAGGALAAAKDVGLDVGYGIDMDEESSAQHRALKTRVAFLEQVIRELESQLASTRSEAGMPPPLHPHSPSDPLPSVLALVGQVVHQQRSLTQVESMVAALGEQVDWVKQHYPSLLDLEQGALKVITLPEGNPSHARREDRRAQEAAAARAQIEALNKKVDELQNRLHSGTGGSIGDPSSSAATGSDPSALATLEATYSARLSKLESEKQQLEKMSARLKAVFSAKVLEFRAACYRLTGFKIELVGANKWRMKSMYAEREEDCLMFQQGATPTATAAGGEGATGAAAGGDAASDGTLSVLETDFTSRLDGHLTTYLTQMNSIPGFLAAVTLQLLERQTKIR